MKANSIIVILYFCGKAGLASNFFPIFATEMWRTHNKIEKNSLLSN